MNKNLRVTYKSIDTVSNTHFLFEMIKSTSKSVSSQYEFELLMSTKERKSKRKLNFASYQLFILCFEFNYLFQINKFHTHTHTHRKQKKHKRKEKKTSNFRLWIRFSSTSVNELSAENRKNK